MQEITALLCWMQHLTTHRQFSIKEFSKEGSEVLSCDLSCLRLVLQHIIIQLNQAHCGVLGEGAGEQGREGVTQKYSNFMKLHTNVCVRVGGCCSGGLLLLAGSY